MGVDVYFRQLLNDETACASYLLGCKRHSAFAVVDPHVDLVDEHPPAAAGVRKRAWVTRDGPPDLHPRKAGRHQFRLATLRAPIAASGCDTTAAKRTSRPCRRGAAVCARRPNCGRLAGDRATRLGRQIAGVAYARHHQRTRPDHTRFRQRPGRAQPQIGLARRPGVRS